VTRFDLVKWRDLTPRDRQAWAAFRAADPGLRSPFFALGWFDAVHRARGDLLVLRGLRGGEPVGFFAFHPGPMGCGWPAGGTFSDWHGFVAAPDAEIDATRALAAGLHMLRFRKTPASDRVLRGFADATGESNVMDLSGGFEAYARPEGRGAPKSMSEFRRAMRKLEAGGRELQVQVRDPRGEVLEALMALKSQQYQRTGRPDVFAWAWSRRLMAELMQTRSEGFEAVLSSLSIDGALASTHLGLRSGGVLHYWLPAYDPALSGYAPGSLLAIEIARTLAGEGLTEMDLGPGSTPWKHQFANATIPLVSGAVYAASPLGRLNAAAFGMARRSRGLHQVYGRLERELGRFAGRPA